MTSLNEVYERKELFYYCNTCGDINLPDTDIMSIHDSEELPLRERNLYENYWMEGAGCNMYVVRYANHTAMALGFLFDDSYLSDLMHKDDVTEYDMDRFYVAVRDYASILEKDAMVRGCDVLVGKDTDPCGHEILVVVPYEFRDSIERIAKYLDENVYASVEELL